MTQRRNDHKHWAYETPRFRLRMLACLALAGAAGIGLAYGLAYFLYQSQMKSHRAEPPAVFPAPQLAVADDRSPGWHARGGSAISETELAEAKRRVLSRGVAAYESPEARQ
jgi:hypothetical protein